MEDNSLKRNPTLTVDTPPDFAYPLPHDGTLPQEVVNALLVENGPYFVHPQGSPYLGLLVREQKTLAKMRRPAGKMPKWRSKQLRKATKKDYEKLVLACTEALVYAWHSETSRLDRISVYVRLPFNWRTYYDKNIPRCIIIGYDDWTVTVGWRVDSILDWLHSRGYCQYKASQIRKNIWSLLQEEEKIDLYYDIAADQSIIELYSELIEGAESGKITRITKGRGRVSRYRKLKGRDKGEGAIDTTNHLQSNNS